MANTNTFTTKQFSHNKLMKGFSAEASTLGKSFVPDQPIILTSHKTGQALVFEPAGPQIISRIEDLEIECWNFRIRRAHTETNQLLRGYTITVFND